MLKCVCTSYPSLLIKQVEEKKNGDGTMKETTGIIKPPVCCMSVTSRQPTECFFAIFPVLIPAPLEILTVLISLYSRELINLLRR